MSNEVAKWRMRKKVDFVKKSWIIDDAGQDSTAELNVAGRNKLCITEIAR